MTVGRAARDDARRIRRTPIAIVTEAGKVARREFLRQAQRDAGSDLRLRNLPGVKLGVKADPIKRGDGAENILTPNPPRARAPWSWLEKGTKPHDVPRKLRRFSGNDRFDKRGRLAGKRARMQVNGKWASGPWSVRGVTPKRTWTRGKDDAEPEARKVGRVTFGRVMRNG